MPTLRMEFVETVTVPLGVSGGLIPVPGIATTIYNVNADGSEGTQANAYAARTGSTPASSLVTDDNGTVAYWLDPGDYNIHFDDQQSPPRIPSFIRGFSSVLAFQSADFATLQAAVNSLQTTAASLQASVTTLQTEISDTYAFAYYSPGSDLAIGSGYTIVPIDTRGDDPHNLFNLSTHAYVCPRPARYEVLACVSPYASADQQVQLGVVKNGTRIRDAGGGTSVSGLPNGPLPLMAATINCVANDTIQCQLWSNVSGFIYRGASLGGLDNWMQVRAVA